MNSRTIYQNGVQYKRRLTGLTKTVLLAVVLATVAVGWSKDPLSYWRGPTAVPMVSSITVIGSPTGAGIPTGEGAGWGEGGNLREAEAEGSSSYRRVQVQSLKLSDTLWLVNQQHPLTKAGASSLLEQLTAAYREVPLSNSEIQINSTVLEALKHMLKEVPSAGGKQLVVTSGYRSRVEQEQLYRHAANKSYVQKPDASEHQTGLAVDLQLLQGGNLGDTEQGRWLAEYSWKFGFVLRYPEGKEEITGIAYEPWHFRYVGLPHAYMMKANNLALEEYLAEWLPEYGGYELSIGGRTYQVYYQQPSRGSILVPAKGVYTVSGDNRGGYVVTTELRE